MIAKLEYRRPRALPWRRHLRDPELPMILDEGMLSLSRHVLDLPLELRENDLRPTLGNGPDHSGLMVLWTIAVVELSPHAQAICAAMPGLAVTLGLTFAGVAFAIGSDL